MNRPHYKLKKRLMAISRNAEKVFAQAPDLGMSAEDLNYVLNYLSLIEYHSKSAYQLIEKDRERVIATAKDA